MKKESVSVVKCSSYKNSEVRQALESSLKNINFQIKPGIKVLIKPNLLSAIKPEAAITTHPVVVEELCKILKQKKCRVYIGESSAMNTDQAFQVCGINQLKKYAKIINFEAEEKRFLNLGAKMHRVPVPKILFEMDLVINIAKMKTHALTQVTLCVKNLYGCIPGRLKDTYHKVLPSPKNFSKLLVKLAEIINPELNIIDGVTGIEGNGPSTSGKITNPKLIIASKNAFAADITASEMMGFHAKSVYTNKLGKLNRNDTERVGDGKEIKLKFKKPSTAYFPYVMFMLNLLSKSKISFDKEKCKQCHLCEQKCPVQAITLQTKDKFPCCNHKKCIHCLCCMEVCPHKAVYLKEHWFISLLKKIKKGL